MKEKSSPINIIWFTMVFLSLGVASILGTLEEVTGSLFSSAKTAVTIALGLIGPMALWLGFMKVAEAGGLMRLVAKLLSPVMKRLFPEIPPEHPAMSAIIMNMAANMLGLGNAATPMGIKAMQEMQKLNPRKDTATNSMALFLAINTSSVTLLPLGVIALRASEGNTNPASILLPSLAATLCSTTVAIIMAKLLEKKNPLPPLEITPAQQKERGDLDKEIRSVEDSNVELLRPTFAGRWFGLLLISLFIAGILYRLTLSPQWTALMDGNWSEAFSTASMQNVTNLLIPVVVLSLLGFGYFRGVKVYETVTDGAKEGFQTAVRIIPFMVAIIVAIGMVKSSGLLESIKLLLQPVTDAIGLPVEALSLAIMRPLSGGGSYGMLSEIIHNNPNGFLADLVSTMQGSTETTFYVLAVYFGAIGIKKSRHAIPAALTADFAGLIAAFLIVKIFMY